MNDLQTIQLDATCPNCKHVFPIVSLPGGHSVPVEIQRKVDAHLERYRGVALSSLILSGIKDEIAELVFKSIQDFPKDREQNYILRANIPCNPPTALQVEMKVGNV